ncbi:Alpha/Beta hydrolase protein [Aspergillus caelatus]|uniref:Carboxylic ester hydrolase n=1 Tax=Aspergillus caelatus TaxID=61420 RepID=A0A5N6ZXW0_9EURO|nr:Alpha/Beta hydrolase protein [Aspergillus caelatus]KAE8361739.1 Alpha/Beta hydrolase protein [Aspergillus caelatus]
MKGLSLGLPLLVPLVNAVVAPTVDLGYTIHQASVESTKDGMRYLNFTNLQYGASRRFQPPIPPPVNRTIQSAGAYNIRCPQGEPAWLSQFGQPVGNLTEVPPVTIADLPAIDPSISEDCLYLDIFVPEAVFQAKEDRKSSVIIWIHGGGYVSGWKSLYGPGLGLMETAKQAGHDVIFVSINYRLGLFGFLADPDSNEVTCNLGLQDQRFALQWVNKNIHLFGGDPSTVTVMGESAGGGSIMYHLTSGNASYRPLFQRAIAQSPFTINIPAAMQRSTLQEVFQRANVTSFEQLKGLPTQALQTANALVVGNAMPYGTFVFGPVSDKNYLDYPPVLLGEGHYPDDVSVMAGHNTNEGVLFASPFVKSDEDYANLVSSLFPGISPTALSVVTDNLYPGNFSGEYGYADQTGRVASTIGESLISCNQYFLGEAFNRSNTSFRYEFSVPPAIHAVDLSYTFYNPSESVSGLNVTLAKIMQRYFVNFITTGQPYSHLPRDFLADDMIQNFNISRVGPSKDSVSTKRCDWWQKATFR